MVKDLPNVSGMRAGGLFVRQANIAKDIIFRYRPSASFTHCRRMSEFEVRAYDLVKHETLSVDFDRYPFDIPIQLGITDVDLYHKSLDGTVIERFADGVIVIVTTVS